MTKMIKLTHFDNETTWEKNTPTNKEILKDVWINTDKVVAVTTTKFYIPRAESSDDEYVPKTVVAFEGTDNYYIVNESIEEVLALLNAI